MELEDDAAHVNMGGNWHIPTPKQIQELFNNTTTGLTDDGMLFTSKKDTSKSIFFPTAGYALVGFNKNGYFGNIWSSILDSDYIKYGTCLELDFYGYNFGVGRYTRNLGYSVRGVIDG